MALTQEDLKQIESLLDRKLDEKLEEKLEQKFDEKLAPIYARLDRIEVKLDEVQRIAFHTAKFIVDKIEPKLENHEGPISNLELVVRKSERLYKYPPATAFGL